MTTRLETIATRQRKFRTRDLMFAAFIAMLVALAATGVGTSFDDPAAVAKR